MRRAAMCNITWLCGWGNTQQLSALVPVPVGAIPTYPTPQLSSQEVTNNISASGHPSADLTLPDPEAGYKITRDGSYTPISGPFPQQVQHHFNFPCQYALPKILFESVFLMTTF